MVKLPNYYNVLRTTSTSSISISNSSFSLQKLHHLLKFDILNMQEKDVTRKKKNKGNATHYKVMTLKKPKDL